MSIDDKCSLALRCLLLFHFCWECLPSLLLVLFQSRNSKWKTKSPAILSSFMRAPQPLKHHLSVTAVTLLLVFKVDSDNDKLCCPVSQLATPGKSNWAECRIWKSYFVKRGALILLLCFFSASKWQQYQRDVDWIPTLLQGAPSKHLYLHRSRSHGNQKQHHKCPHYKWVLMIQHFSKPRPPCFLFLFLSDFLYLSINYVVYSECHFYQVLTGYICDSVLKYWN